MNWQNQTGDHIVKKCSYANMATVLELEMVLVKSFENPRLETLISQIRFTVLSTSHAWQITSTRMSSFHRTAVSISDVIIIQDLPTPQCVAQDELWWEIC